MRLKPRVIVFDKDQGLEMPIRALGGVYTPVKMGVETGFNPFEAESDERGAAWLTDWLEAMLRPKDGEYSPRFRSKPWQKPPATIPKPRKTSRPSAISVRSCVLSTTARICTPVSASWDKGGQFEWLFNGKGQDSLNFKSDVVAFDLSEIFDNDDVRTTWLSYVFRRIERMVEDERPTLIVMDEAWKLLDDPYFQSRLKDWMLTMRRKYSWSFFSPSGSRIFPKAQLAGQLSKVWSHGSFIRPTATRPLNSHRSI